MVHHADHQITPNIGRCAKPTPLYTLLTATTINHAEPQGVQQGIVRDKPHYLFGVEIETIATPHRVRVPLRPAVYYKKLAQALVSHSLQARADDLKGKYRKHPEEYERGWWITRDPSLNDPIYPGSAC